MSERPQASAGIGVKRLPHDGIDSGGRLAPQQR